MEREMTEPQASEFDVRLLRRGAPEAVERWFERYADRLYTFVYYRVGRDPELSAEVTQETFVAALGRIGDYDPDRGAMMAWLTYLARNRIRAALRHRARSAGPGPCGEEIDARLLRAYRRLDSDPLPDEIIERRETAELVRMALSNLPERYREALTRHYCEKESLAEIARAGSTTEGAVKSLLHRARLAFKAAFETMAESLGEAPPARRVTP